MGERYKVIEGSESAHCCFEATVIDTHQPRMIADFQYFKTVCECFDVESAELVCKALNDT